MSSRANDSKPNSGKLSTIGAAEAAAYDADSQVERASKRQLAAHLILPPRERLDLLHDPDLTSSDRRQLMQSIRRILPNYSSSNSRRTSTMQWFLAFLWRNIITVATLIVLMSAAASFGWQAWRHTGRIVYFAKSETLNFDMPNGATRSVTIPGNTPISVVRRDARTQVRLWIKRAGYIYSTVNLADPGDAVTSR